MADGVGDGGGPTGVAVSLKDVGAGSFRLYKRFAG